MNILTLRGPADVAAALPSLLGFHPTNSLVVIAFRAERVVLTMRVDLPDCVSQGWAHDVLTRTARSQPDAYVFVVADREFRPEFGRDAIDALMNATELDVVDALMVGGQKWRSFLCVGECCPVDGTPIDQTDVDRIRCQMTVQGQVVATDRDAIRAEFAFATARVTVEELEHFDESKRARVESVVARLGSQAECTFDADERLLISAVREPHVRDAVLWMITTTADSVNHVLLRNLAELVRHTADAAVDGIALVAATTAWLLGDGARGVDACERALEANPELVLAQLLHRALAAGLPPSLWRDGMRSVSLEQCWAGELPAAS